MQPTYFNDCRPFGVAGRILWSNEIQNYTGVPGYSRTSPAVEGGILVIGTSHGGIAKYSIIPNSTFILGVNATTGELIWRTLVSPHPLAIVTTSPTIYNGGGGPPIRSFDSCHDVAPAASLLQSVLPYINQFANF